MGERLDDPTLGRFLQTDPVPGGSANAYDYANQDPTDQFDLTGQWPHWPEECSALGQSAQNDNPVVRGVPATAGPYLPRREA